MTSILIIDDHQIVTNAVKLLIIENIEDVNIFKAADFPSAIDTLVCQKKIDLIVLDIGIPGGRDHLMIEEIRKIHANVPILIFSANDESSFAAQYLRSGANGFVSKAADEEDLLAAIKIVLSGGKYISPHMQQLILEEFIENKPAQNEASTDYRNLLTAREYDVFLLLLKGKWTKEIADELQIKLSTVSAHKTRIFEKFQVDNVIDLFKKVQKNPI
jgi:two-component system invasion response regulator UvrY